MIDASTPPPPAEAHPARRHLAALIIGCLLILPGLGLLLGGAGVAGTYAFGRDDAGFLSMTVPTLRTPTAAITVEDIVVEAGPDVPAWVLDRLDLDLRITARSLTPGADLFIGVAPAEALSSYLDGVAHDQVIGISEPRSGVSRAAVLRRSPGGATVGAPTGETFWATSATGTGEQRLTWEVTGGSWAVALMNADGSPGVDVSSTIGVRAGFLLPLALLLMGLGLIITGIAVALIIRGASSGGPSAPPPPGAPPATVPLDGALAGAPLAAPATGDAWQLHPRAVSPVSINARLDEPLSRWLWLVKWFLAIPHFIVLGFLWIAFFVVAVVAFFAILFTGTYPRGLFDFNLGVLRWSWRVSYYCSNGGIGTDRYPPFSLEVEPDYPARLDIAYPEHLSRGLVLIKWWLLAIPHYLIVGLLVGGARVGLELLAGGRRSGAVLRLERAGSARARRGHLAALHGPLPAGALRPRHRAQPVGLPRRCVRNADDGRLPTVPARRGWRRGPAAPARVASTPVLPDLPAPPPATARHDRRVDA